MQRIFRIEMWARVQLRQGADMGTEESTEESVEQSWWSEALRGFPHARG